MNKELKKFLETEFKTKARIIDSKIVEVTAQDGEKFILLCPIGRYISKETQNYELHRIEAIFDSALQSFWTGRWDSFRRNIY